MKDTTHYHLLKRLGEMDYEVRCDVVYIGSMFTVVKATAKMDDQVHTHHPLHPKHLEAEGVSRRSVKDSPNAIMGRMIAEGRALKALLLKAQGIKDLHRRHLLMG